MGLRSMLCAGACAALLSAACPVVMQRSCSTAEKCPVCRDPEFASIFQKRLDKGVKAPALPKKAVELLPMLTSASDPQPPPVQYVMRTVLFVDCVGREPLAIFAVDVLEGQSMAAVAELVLKKAMPGKVRIHMLYTAPISPVCEPWPCLSLVHDVSSQYLSVCRAACRHWARTRS